MSHSQKHVVGLVFYPGMSGGGVTAGSDFGLEIAKVLYGDETAKMVQLLMEYDPAPPFNTGSPEKAGADLVNKAIAYASEALNLKVKQVV